MGSCRLRCTFILQSFVFLLTSLLQAGYINLFTLRHDPGRLIHVMNGHQRTPISALCLDYDEKGFFSAGWDGVAIVRFLQRTRSRPNDFCYSIGISIRGRIFEISPHITPSSLVYACGPIQHHTSLALVGRATRNFQARLVWTLTPPPNKSYLRLHCINSMISKELL